MASRRLVAAMIAALVFESLPFATALAFVDAP